MRTLPLAVLLFAAPSLLAFSAGGHRIIADIAWQKMNTDARTQAIAILRKHPRLEEDLVPRMPDSVKNAKTPTKQRWLFFESSTWPDLARGIDDQDERGKYDRPTHHYINFATYLRDEDKKRIDLSRVNRSTEWDGDYTKEKLNVIQALKLNVAGYRDELRSDAERAVHLCWILHLVGDSHSY